VLAYNECAVFLESTSASASALALTSSSHSAIRWKGLQSGPAGNVDVNDVNVVMGMGRVGQAKGSRRAVQTLADF
jgi:hypothetical protein